ncbi:holocytochrome-c synthase [Malassezia sp. CBS 17886]|nr:holocytochrome-c synthase [Malassezia sp. CBS 17886]
MVWPFSSAPAPARAAADTNGACPVDHSTRETWVEQTSCPVDHDTQAAFLEQHAGRDESRAHRDRLSQERIVSSIPRHYRDVGDAGEDRGLSAHADADAAATTDRDAHWVYPSPSQFYRAVVRKNNKVRAEDMDVVVPIHNAVNEEAWRHILEWEKTWNAPGCECPELVNFIGRPRNVTWRARFRNLAGYTLPFDRHDWVVTMRYVIDFYAGRPASGAGHRGGAPAAADAMHKAADAPQQVSFHLDVRPAPDTVEGIAMRLHRWWQGW